MAFFDIADIAINNRELYEASVDTAVRHHTVLLRGAIGVDESARGADPATDAQ